MEIKDCIIIGAGPCGIGAAIELKKFGVDAFIIEKGPIGGKINIAPRVDNYPGYTKIIGPDLAFEFYMKAKSNGIKIVGDEVLSLKKEENFVVKCKRETYYAKTVLVACGTKEKTLGLDNEDNLFGHGVSYCAICDGHFYRGQDTCVVGGSEYAVKEALYLASLCNKVTLIHYENKLGALPKLMDELKCNNNVEILTPYVITSLNGKEVLESIDVKNVETGETKTISLQGCFPLVGQNPQATFVEIENVLDEFGTIPVDKSMKTTVEGLFAGGDILPRDLRQIYLAEHDGMVAAKSICNYLKGE